MSSLSLSPLKVFLFTLRFAVTHIGPILRRIAVPAILGIVAFYFLMAGYLQLVEAYLEVPSGGNASRILGVAALGVLVMLFLHSQLVSAVAGLLLEGRRESFMHIYAHEWRLFVAGMQLVLIVCIYSCAFWMADKVAVRLELPPPAGSAAKLVLLAILFWILVRAWFFLLPLCVSTGEGEMLVRSWQASRAHFWKITGLLLLTGLVVAFCHALLQLLLWLFDAVPPLPSTISIARALDMHRALLLPFVLLMSGTYIPAAILTTVARIRFYQDLTDSGLPRHEG